MNKHVRQEIKHLPVVVFNLHLHIQASELAEMSVGVWIFSSEDRSDLEYSVEATAKGHLLVQLRGLSEAALLIEVLELEDIAATFWGSSDQLGRVNFNELLLHEELSE